MKIKIMLTHFLVHKVGSDRLELELPDHAKARDLRVEIGKILNLEPRIIEELILLRNGVALYDNDPLSDGDEITVMPPVSGG